MDQNRIEGAAKETEGTLESAAGDVFGDTKTQAEGLVNQVAGQAQNAFGNVKDAARQIAGDAPKYVNDALDTGQRAYRQGSQMVQDRMGNVPLTEMLLAGAAGYLLAWLIHSRD